MKRILSLGTSEVSMVRRPAIEEVYLLVKGEDDDDSDDDGTKHEQKQSAKALLGQALKEDDIEKIKSLISRALEEIEKGSEDYAKAQKKAEDEKAEAEKKAAEGKKKEELEAEAKAKAEEEQKKKGEEGKPLEAIQKSLSGIDERLKKLEETPGEKQNLDDGIDDQKKTKPTWPAFTGKAED